MVPRKRVRTVKEAAMESGKLTDLVFPCESKALFDRVLLLDWYDGYTSGLASNSLLSQIFRFSLLVWDSQQGRRVFVLYPIAPSDLEEVLSFMKKAEAAAWPAWNPARPRNKQSDEELNLQLTSILARINSPEYLIACDNIFETILAARDLTPRGKLMLPTNREELSLSDDFDYWHGYLGKTQ